MDECSGLQTEAHLRPSFSMRKICAAAAVFSLRVRHVITRTRSGTPVWSRRLPSAPIVCHEFLWLAIPEIFRWNSACLSKAISLGGWPTNWNRRNIRSHRSHDSSSTVGARNRYFPDPNLHSTLSACCHGSAVIATSSVPDSTLDSALANVGMPWSETIIPTALGALMSQYAAATSVDGFVSWYRLYLQARLKLGNFTAIRVPSREQFIFATRFNIPLGRVQGTHPRAFGQLEK